MKIAIDIDGTITANPPFFKHFITNQLSHGNEIHILTGHLTTWGPDFNVVGAIENLPVRINQLNALGITEWTKLMSVGDCTLEGVGIQKGIYCRDNNIHFIFENDLLYIAKIKEIAPLTQNFLIR